MSILLAAVMIAPVVPLVASAPLARAATASASASTFGQGSPQFMITTPGAAHSIQADEGEPNLGVDWRTGNAMMNSGFSQYRVTFNDATSPPSASWTAVDGNDLYQGFGSLDPIMYTDPVTGRTWMGQEVACGVEGYTDNDGQSFLPTAGDCPAPGWDHPSMGAGVCTGAVASECGDAGQYPSRATYYCSQTGEGLTSEPYANCVVSYDGGLTWPVHSQQLGCGYLEGFVRVGPDGVAYIPSRFSGGAHSCASVSTNSGLTWSTVTIPDSTQPSGDNFDPSIAIGRGDQTNGHGRVYFAWYDQADHVHVTTSPDDGSTWTASKDVTPTGAQATTFYHLEAGDDDRAALIYLAAFNGTTGSPLTSAANNGYNGHWDLMVSFTYDGGSTWTTYDVTPNDPVQRGNICDGGNNCATGTRNLLDYLGGATDAQGRVLVGFADGCIGTCVTGGSNSGTAVPTLARQTAGLGLFAKYDTGGSGPSPLSVAVGGPYAGLVGNAISIAAAASGGAPPYSYSWAVTSKPSSSNGGSIGNANAAATTFTPDVPGTYSLTVTAHDAAAGTASAIAQVTATVPNVAGCQSGGVTLASDPSADAQNGLGDASEIYCLRASDTATSIDFYYDVKGQGVGSSVGSSNPLLFDLLFSDKALGGDTNDQITTSSPFGEIQQFEIETTWDGSALSTHEYNYFTGLGVQGQTFTTAWEGNTLHVSWARSGAATPANGDTLESMQLVSHVCTTTACTEGDADPSSAPLAVYTVGGVAQGGGTYYPLCGEVGASDSSADSTQAEPGTGARDLTQFAMSDDASNVTFCWTAMNLSDHPTDESSYTGFFSAPYQAPGVAYSVNVAVNPDGSIDAANSGWAQGACDPVGDCGTVGGGSALAISISGNTILETIAKSSLGSPADGSATGSIAVDVRSLSDTTGANAYDKDTATAFTFGKRITDTQPPTQVTGLAVADPQTGHSLDLSWAPASDDTGVTQYNVARSTTSGGPYTVVGTPSGTSFVDAGLATGTTYYYVVNAQDVAGNVGPNSTEASGTPTLAPDTNPPSVPQNLVTCGATTSSICVAWSPSSDPQDGVKQYDVYRDGALVGSATTTSYTDSGLASNATYTYQVSAVDNANLESAKSAPLTAKTLGFTGPAIAVISPASGASLGAPLTISGNYSTTGQPTQASTHALPDVLPWQANDWAASAFVQTALRSAELRDVRSEVASLAGFLGLYPTADGQVMVLLSGKVPAHAPTKSPNLGWPVAYTENVRVDMIRQTAQHPPTNVVTLDQLRHGAKLDAAPTGPPTPGIESGIGPGTAIQMHDPIDGQTYICTASFLTQNPATGKYYLMTAGHCLLDTSKTPTDSVNDPTYRADKVFLCYAQCINNYVSLGHYVELDATSTWTPVAYAHQGGIGDDMGLIEIPPELNQYLRPWDSFWSGPTGAPASTPATGDLLVHYGHGVASGAVFATQGRAAVTIGGDANSFEALGYIYGGDSGSAIEFGQPDAGRGVTGGAAVGIVTHATGVSTPVGFPGNNFYGTQFEHALDMAQPHLGFRPVLVTQDEAIAPGGSGGASSLTATIAAPANEASFPSGSDVQASGTAVFGGAQAGPGNGSVTTYYAWQDPATGACGRLHLETTLEATQQGCSPTLAPVGPVAELVLGPASLEYDSAALGQPLYLDPSQHVTADIYVEGEAGSSPVLLDVEVQLLDGSTLVGSQRQTATVTSGTGATDLKFSFAPQETVVPSGDELKLVVLMHQADGPAGVFSGGSTPSGVHLALGTPPPLSVDLSVDDPTFSPAHAVATSGLSSWTATIPAAMLATLGAHEIFVRASNGAQHGASSTANVTTTPAAGSTPPTASFTFTTSGDAASFTDASTAGSSAIVYRNWTFGDGSSATGATVTHTYELDGSYQATLLVTDANGLSSQSSQTVSVSATHVWSINLTVTDANGGQALPTTSVGTVAAGDGTWSFFWNATPPAGTYTATAQLLQDGSPVASGASTFTLIVPNQAPVVNPIAAQAVQQNSTLVFTATGSDPDGDAIAWSLVSGPPGMTFDAPNATATWTPTFSQLGAYSATIGASDGQITTTVTVPITVLLTPRPAVLSPVATQTAVENTSAIRVAVRAASLNFDTPTLTATGLPAGATFVDDGDGTGVLAWSPGLGTAGTYAPVVTATDMGLASTVTVPIVILQDSAVAVSKVGGASTLQVSPGRVVTMTANVTNTGPETDTYAIATAGSWHPSPIAPVTLAPGQTQAVTFTVTVPAWGSTDAPRLTARSLGNPNVAAGAVWSLQVSIVLNVTFDGGGVFLPVSDVTGTVVATYGDGTVVPGAAIKVTQTSDLVGNETTTSIAGHADANGAFVLDFPLGDVKAHVPASHTVVVQGAAAVSATTTTSYSIGVPATLRAPTGKGWQQELAS